MTREIILKRYERGMKPAAIAALDGLELAHVEKIIAASDVKPIKREKNVSNGQPKVQSVISNEEIKRRLLEGETQADIENDFGFAQGGLHKRVKRIKQENGIAIEPVKTGRTPKVTDDHLIEYVNSGKTCMEIARIMKTSHSNLKKRLVRLEIFEQAEANKQAQAELAAQETAVTTECDGFAENYTIAALMKEEEQMTEAIAEVKQDVPGDKWVHFVASQIDNARVKTKFDVVQQGKKFIKRTEVRFVIEEELV